MRSTVRRPADAPASAPALLFPLPHTHTHTHTHAHAHTVTGPSECLHLEPQPSVVHYTMCTALNKLPSLAAPDEGFRPLARGDEEALLARMPDVIDGSTAPNGAAEWATVPSHRR